MLPVHRRLAAFAVLLAAALATPGAARSQMVILAFGDSITDGLFDDPGRGGYPRRLQQILLNRGLDATVENFGVASEDTVAGLARIDSVLRDGGDLLLLMEGTNDIGHISPETTLFNLTEMARRSEASGVAVVHATLMPRKRTANEDPRNIANGQLAASLRELAWSSGRALADPFEVFGSTPNFVETLYSDDPEDEIGHPNAEGYDLLAQIFADVLTEADNVAPVTGSFRPADGSRNVSPDATLEVVLYDFGHGIDLDTSMIIVNGVPVATAASGDERRATLSHQLRDQPDGTVRFAVRAQDLNPTGPNMASRALSTFRVGFGVPGGPLPGDVDADGRVDGADLVAFALRFGADQGDPRYDPLFDFTADGRIDGEDLAVLAGNFGESG